MWMGSISLSVSAETEFSSLYYPQSTVHGLIYPQIP